jgi:hypothetical protein
MTSYSAATIESIVATSFGSAAGVCVVAAAAALCGIDDAVGACVEVVGCGAVGAAIGGRDSAGGGGGGAAGDGVCACTDITRPAAKTTNNPQKTLDHTRVLFISSTPRMRLMVS